LSTAEHVQVPIASSTAPPNHRGDSHDGVREPLPHRSWAVLALALVAQVLVVLDISVVNTALPTIGAELHLGGSDLQWLVTAYLLMSGGGLLLGGRIADLLSRRTGAGDRPVHVHQRLVGQRFRVDRGCPDRRPGRAGCGCGADDSGGVGDHHDDVLGCPAGEGPGAVGCGRRHGHRGRGSGRWRDHHLGGMAGDLLGQRADRGGCDRRGDGDPAEASPNLQGFPGANSISPADSQW